jgi:hypothetical protein
MSTMRKIPFAFIAGMLFVSAYAVSWQTLSENQRSSIYQTNADSIGLPLSLLLVQTIVIFIGAAIALLQLNTFSHRKLIKFVALLASTLMSTAVVIGWFDKHHIQIVAAYSFAAFCTAIFYFLQKTATAQ